MLDRDKVTAEAWLGDERILVDRGDWGQTVARMGGTGRVDLCVVDAMAYLPGSRRMLWPTVSRARR